MSQKHPRKYEGAPDDGNDWTLGGTSMLRSTGDNLDLFQF